MNAPYELISLFTVSFLAATVLPAQSEVVLAGLQLSKVYNPVALVGIATFGNVLGALVNWFLGRYLIHFQNKRWFPIKEKMIDKATIFYQKRGVWTLLLAWTPFIGDPLTLVAGIFRTNIWLFLLLVTIGKATRYIGIIIIL